MLDIGCGEGQLSRVAAGLPGVRHVVGIDPTERSWRRHLQREPGGRGARRLEPGRGSRADGARDDGRPAWSEQRARPGPVRPGAATAFPFPASFDAAFACLVFEHIEGTAEALAEVGRVLRPGGTFLLFLNHPLLQAPGSGWVDDHILGEQYWRIGAYLLEHHGVEEVDKNIWIPFVHRPFRCTSTPWWQRGFT